MATIQSDNGWTKTELGDGWVKLVEVSDPFGSNAADIVLSTPITNTTSNAVANGPSMPIVNELKAAGSFVIQATSGAGASLNADLYLDLKDTSGTYQNASGKIAEDLGPSATKIASYSGAMSDGMKVKAIRDAGTSANPITFSLIYYNGGPNQSDVTIGGVGADPS
jgi:hypothetical protein